MTRRGLVIAIDGVVGAGKTATARRVADELGYRHLDTGAMYRAVTLAARRAGVGPEDAALEGLLAGLRLELRPGGAVLLGAEDVSDAIRDPEISRRVGAYADRPSVRRALIDQQRSIGADGGVVGEGRDVGSVVFPDADLKVLLTADLSERVRRRHAELLGKGVDTAPDEVEADIRRRDAEDARRDYGAPPPADLRRLDTTDLTLEEQVGRVVAWARGIEAGSY